MDKRKWLTEPDNYVCNYLSEETQRIAKDELNEDTFRRDQALSSLRQWITQNRDIINCRLDSKFLLRFLRFNKFSVVKTEESLERYLALRQMYNNAFRSLDIYLPVMQELTDLGLAFVCPKRDRNGRRVFICRPGSFDLKKYTSLDLMKFGAIILETLVEDEENQVRGFVYVCDGRGVGLSYTTLFSPMEVAGLIKNGEFKHKYIQTTTNLDIEDNVKTIPARHVEAIGFNIHPSMKCFLDFGLSFLSEKMRNRIKVYTSLENLLAEATTLDFDVLPKEFGGIMPMDDMIKLWKEEMHKSNALLLSYDKMQIDDRLCVDKSLSLDKNYADSWNGISGSFRKLEID